MTEKRVDEASRLAVLETSVEALSDDMSKLTRIVESLASSVSGIAAQIGGVGKASTKEWMTMLVTVGGFVIMSGGGLWAIAIAPVNNENKSQNDDIADLHNRMATVELLRSHTRLKLEEVETQFRASDVVRNEQLQSQERTNALLWLRVYGEGYPMRDYWPEIGKQPDPIQ